MSNFLIIGASSGIGKELATALTLSGLTKALAAELLNNDGGISTLKI